MKQEVGKVKYKIFWVLLALYYVLCVAVGVVIAFALFEVPGMMPEEWMMEGF